MSCVHWYLTKEVSTSVKLEVSQDTNCGWRDIMVQACDVRHVYHWLRRRETGLLGSGQKIKKVSGVMFSEGFVYTGKFYLTRAQCDTLLVY